VHNGFTSDPSYLTIPGRHYLHLDLAAFDSADTLEVQVLLAQSLLLMLARAELVDEQTRGPLDCNQITRLQP
jgi:hypothetical protein